MEALQSDEMVNGIVDEWQARELASLVVQGAVLDRWELRLERVLAGPRAS